MAASAGVSQTTVSHALSGKGRLPDATRERVIRIADELGYRPNASARNLVQGKTGLVGMAVSTSPESPFGLSDFEYFVQLIGAASGAIVEHGRSLVIEGTETGSEAFADVELDGAIVVDPVDGDPLLSSLRSRGVPVVTTGREDDEDEEARRCWVDNDHRSATIAMMKHLEESGAERLGLICGYQFTSYSRDVLAGYRAWCEESGQSPMVALAEGGLSENSGREAAEKLLGLPSPPDAIYSTLDQVAIGVLGAARARSLSVPGDLLVACGTDSPLSRLANPPITSVDFYPEKIGRTAVEMLVGLIDGADDYPAPVTVETRLLPRRSTGA